MNARSSWMPAGSSPFDGSSRINSSGSLSSARAIPSRWRMPSEYPFTRSPARSVRPARSSTASIRTLAPGGREAAAKRRFSRPVRWPWKRGSSTIAPIRLSAEVPGEPSTENEPAVGRARPSKMRISVVLPAPFGPRKPNAQPRGTARSMPSTATREP